MLGLPGPGRASATDGGHAEVDGLAGAADNLHGFGDLAPVGFAERLEVVFGPADELAQPGDLRVRGHGLGPGPVVEVGGGADAFAVAQQGVEVVAQLGQVGGVGAEVAAAQAAEPERAGSAAGLDVGRLGADRRTGPRPGRPPGAGVRFPAAPGLGSRPVFAAAVELEGCQGVHRVRVRFAVTE